MLGCLFSDPRARTYMLRLLVPLAQRRGVLHRYHLASVGSSRRKSRSCTTFSLERLFSCRATWTASATLTGSSDLDFTTLACISAALSRRRSTAGSRFSQLQNCFAKLIGTDFEPVSTAE